MIKEKILVWIDGFVTAPLIYFIATAPFNLYLRIFTIICILISSYILIKSADI